ncbi:MAG: response regulator transcription factor [Prevotellaceae bacterium]|jgi:DNA-binding NarL/FixJ family response regulator|nr:response regulator transcription factor [Prevotellaceae bacterium]
MMKTNCQDSISNPLLISVVIVDDHKILVEGLEQIINDSGKAQVIDRAYSVAECREMLKRCNPDILMLDVSLSDGNGIELCAEICQNYPAINILMLTSYAESSVIVRAMDAGALGYVLKNAMSDEIIEGVLTVASGKKFFCDEAHTLLKSAIKVPVTLSARETEVLKLIVEGLSMREIAEKLFLSYETVRSYGKYLHMKLDVHNTASLVRKAIEQKFI